MTNHKLSDERADDISSSSYEVSSDADVTADQSLYCSPSSSSSSHKHGLKNSGNSSQWLMLILVLVIGASSLYVTYGLPSQNLDGRNQASSGTGTVIITSPQHLATTTINQPYEFTLAINTYTIPVDGVQLDFTIQGVNTSNNPALLFDQASVSLIPLSVNGGQLSILPAQTAAISNITNGVNVRAAIVPDLSLRAFSSNSNLQFLKIRFTAHTPGKLMFSFNPTSSKVTQKRFLDNPQPLDILKTVGQMQLTLVSPTPSSSPSPSPTPMPSPSASPSASPSSSPSSSPSPTPMPSPSPSPSPLNLPIAIVTSPLTTHITLNDNQAATLTGMGRDAQGGTTGFSYRWKFSDGVTSTQSSLSKSFNRRGNFTADFTVTDSRGVTSAPVRVFIKVQRAR